MDLPAASDPAELFREAVAIMARLRSQDGCPWDREQTFDSITAHTLEETYEVFDAIDRRHWLDLRDELGDLLLQVIFYSQMAAEPGLFTIADVLGSLNRKLIRRHPHVFGEEAAAAAGNGTVPGLATAGIDAAQVLRNWDAIKQLEKKQAQEKQSQEKQSGEKQLEGNERRGSGCVTQSILDDIPRSFPAMLEARKLGSRAGKVGFDWPEVGGLFAKLEEEMAELRQAIEESSHAGDPPYGQAAAVADAARAQPPPRTAGPSEAMISEVGDLLFTAVNLARHLDIDPELALRRTNAKFRRRFACMETLASEPLETLSSDQLESLWSEAKGRVQ